MSKITRSPKHRAKLALTLPGMIVTIFVLLACSCGQGASTTVVATPTNTLLPAATATPRPTVTYYTFLLRAFQIFNTRSRGNDTDTVAFSLNVDGQSYPLQIHHTGDIDNGTYFQYMRYVDVAIPSDAHKIVMSYQIVNAGHSDADAAMQAGATQLVNLAIGVGADALGVGWVSTFAVPLADAGIGYLFANCDGPVALDAVSFSPADLSSATANDGKQLSEVREYPGSDSPAGCGSNSDYKVHWTVARASLSSMAYDLASELAIGQYWADYGQTGVMDDTLHDMQRLANGLSDEHVLPAHTLNLFGYIHQQLGNGKSIDDAFGALREELSQEMDTTTGTGRYRDMVTLGTYLALAEAQYVSPLSNWAAAKALAHSYLQTVQSLVSERYSDIGFDRSTLADVLSQSGQPPDWAFSIYGSDEGPLYQEIVALRFAFADTIRKAIP